MATLPLHPAPASIMELDRTTSRGRRHTVEIDVSREQLADLLRETERAHGEYERELGSRDEDWPSWYADYIRLRFKAFDDPLRSRTKQPSARKPEGF